MAAVGWLVGRCYTLLGIVTLNTVGHAAAVGVIVNIAIVAGFCSGILAVEEHICLTQTTANQTGQDRTAGAAPQAECPDQLTAGSALLHSVVENTAGLINPTAAAVVCKANEGIELTLGQRQIILINKFLIDGTLCAGQIVTQQNFRCFLGNAVFLIFLQHIIGATGTVTHGVLAIIPIGFGREAFLFLKDFYQRIADAHFRSCICSRGSRQHKTCKQHNCQNKTGNTFHYRYTPFTQ